PGSYAPGFRAAGTDGTGASFDFFPGLAGAEVSVLGVGVAAVSASPDPVPLGYGALSLVFDVTNVSGTPGDLTGARVSSSAGAFGARHELGGRRGDAEPRDHAPPPGPRRDDGRLHARGRDGGGRGGSGDARVRFAGGSGGDGQGALPRASLPGRRGIGPGVRG